MEAINTQCYYSTCVRMLAIRKQEDIVLLTFLYIIRSNEERFRKHNFFHRNNIMFNENAK